MVEYTIAKGGKRHSNVFRTDREFLGNKFFREGKAFFPFFIWLSETIQKASHSNLIRAAGRLHIAIDHAFPYTIHC